MSGRWAAAALVLVLGVVFLPLAGEAENAVPAVTAEVAPPAPQEPPSRPSQTAAPTAAAEPALVTVAPPAPVAVPDAPPPAPAPSAAVEPQPAPVPMVNPVPDARVSQGWGDAKNPFSGEKVFHRGFDLAAPRGAEVVAGADGVVGRVLIDDDGRDTGRFVIIDHGDGLTSYYGHLDEVLVVAGETVERGQVIATVGMTGLTTGPHIHFEVRRDGDQVDPGLFIDR